MEWLSLNGKKMLLILFCRNFGSSASVKVQHLCCLFFQNTNVKCEHHSRVAIDPILDVWRKLVTYERKLQEFDGIESEWPMFIAYLLIDSVYKGDQSKMDHYQEKLQSLLLHTDEGILTTFVIMYVTTVIKTLVFKMLHAKKRQTCTGTRL